MAVNSPPLFLNGDGVDGEQHRAHLTVTQNNRPGIAASGDLLVSEKSGTPTMSVDVAGGYVYVKGGETTYQGVYLCHNRGTTNVVIAASDATNARKDLIVARVRDAQASGSDNDFDIVVIQGTPAGSPVPDTASIPDNAHVLALVDVAALSTTVVDANITDLRTLDTYGDNDNGTAFLPNGVVNCLSTDRPLQNLFEGMRIYETDLNRELVYDGSGWLLVSGFSGANYPDQAATWTLTSPTGQDFPMDTGAGDYDTDSYLQSGGGVQTELVAPFDGYYMCTCFVRFAADPDGERSVILYKNGSGLPIASEARTGTSTFNQAVSASGVAYFDAGDTFNARVTFVDVGTNIVGQGRMSMTLLGAA